MRRYVLDRPCASCDTPEDEYVVEENDVIVVKGNAIETDTKTKPTSKRKSQPIPSADQCLQMVKCKGVDVQTSVTGVNAEVFSASSDLKAGKRRLVNLSQVQTHHDNRRNKYTTNYREKIRPQAVMMIYQHRGPRIFKSNISILAKRRIVVMVYRQQIPMIYVTYVWDTRNKDIWKSMYSRVTQKTIQMVQNQMPGSHCRSVPHSEGILIYRSPTQKHQSRDRLHSIKWHIR